MWRYYLCMFFTLCVPYLFLLWNSSDEFIFGWIVPRIQKFNFWKKCCVFCNQRFVKRMLWVLFPYVHLLHCTSTWQIVLRLRYTIWNTSFHSTKCTNRVHCLIYLCITVRKLARGKSSVLWFHQINFCDALTFFPLFFSSVSSCVSVSR